jgi:hypothetical protein
MPDEVSLECLTLGKTELPGLSGLKGANHRMIVRLPVLAGMPILRVVATADLTADQAGSEVNPGVAHGDATFADI